MKTTTGLFSLFLLTLFISCSKENDIQSKADLTLKFEKLITVEDDEKKVSANYLIKSNSEKYLKDYLDTHKHKLIKNESPAKRSSIDRNSIDTVKESSFVESTKAAKEVLLIELVGNFPDGYLFNASRSETGLRSSVTTSYRNLQFYKSKYGEAIIHFVTGPTMLNPIESGGYIFLNDRTYGWYYHPRIESDVYKSLSTDCYFITSYGYWN